MVLSVTEAFLDGVSAQRGPPGWRLRKARAVRELGLCCTPGMPWGALAKLTAAASWLLSGKISLLKHRRGQDTLGWCLRGPKPQIRDTVSGECPLRDSPSCLPLPGVHDLCGRAAGPALIRAQGTEGSQPGQWLSVNHLVSKAEFH